MSERPPPAIDYQSVSFIVREFSAGYAERLLERLEEEGEKSEEPVEPAPAK